MPYNYSDSEIAKRASSGGKDPGRKRYADGLMARAQAGDQAALQELMWRSGVAPDPNPNDNEGNWATADARNYGKMLLGRLNTGYTPQYDKANDGSFSVGKALGSVAKIAAPIAGALIPGLGTLGALAVGAGGSALGGALSGEKFDLGKTLGSGLLAAGGNNALGNGLGSGSTNLGFGSTPNIPAAPDIHAMGSQTYTPTGKPYNPAEHVPGAPGHPTPGRGIGAQLGDLFKDPQGKLSLEKLGMVGGGLAKMYGAHQQRKAQGRVMDANLELQRRGLDMAEQNMNEMRPLREMAMQRLGRVGGGNSIFSYGAQ